MNRADDIAAAPVRAQTIGARRLAAMLLREGTDPEHPGPCVLMGVNARWKPSDEIGAMNRSYRSATAAVGHSRVTALCDKCDAIPVAAVRLPFHKGHCPAKLAGSSRD